MIATSGIDLGGTKIEAALFDENWHAIDTRRVPTPKTYDALITALAGQVAWLQRAGDLPVGVGVPGRHDPVSGRADMANVVADGHRLRDDLLAATGRKLAFGNDCEMFAFSEANIGAGKEYTSVFGLVLGTGIGGGTCFNGALHQSGNRATGEVGHLPVSAKLAAEFNLPLPTCGCGRHGCYEALASGPGISRLAENYWGKTALSAEVAASGDAGAKLVMLIWHSLVAELIGALQLTIDPDCIVLGGGLSNMPDVAEKLHALVAQQGLRGTKPPVITKARFGDSSGTRGAALLALKEQ